MLCACQLRSPAQFSDEQFAAFNGRYVETLSTWNLFRDGINPVARSNLVPVVRAPSTEGIYAFSQTIPTPDTEPDFMIAVSDEVPEGQANYRDHIIARGNTSPAGLLQKMRGVLAEQECRLAALGKNWADVTATQVYAEHDIHPFMASDLVARGADASGITWHHVRPPIIGLDYEMDCRGVSFERII